MRAEIVTSKNIVTNDSRKSENNAYENSIENSTGNKNDGIKKNKEKAGLSNTWKNAKFTAFQAVYEFPRQQKETDSNNPEVMQFKASQQLFNPNQPPAATRANKMSNDLLEFVKETKGNIIIAPKKEVQENKMVKPTETEIKQICRDVWLTVISSCHPQTAEAIENHFKVDNGYRLDKLSASLGFRSTEAFLLSDYVSDMIHPTIIKDELDEFGVVRFSAVSFDDITHITDLMSESKLTEEEKEARKDYFRNAKYSKLEYQEKAIEMREKLCEVVNELMLKNLTNLVAWDEIQDHYLKKFGQQLNKKHLREAFPTGHPSKIVEIYMNDEFELIPHPTMTGNLMLKFRKSYPEILDIFKEAKEAVKNPSPAAIKHIEYRTKDNVYVDYVRERQKKDVLWQQKAAEKGAEAEKLENKNSFLHRRSTTPSKFVHEAQSNASQPLNHINVSSSNQNLLSPSTNKYEQKAAPSVEQPNPYERREVFVEREPDPIRFLPDPRVIYPRKYRINYNQ